MGGEAAAQCWFVRAFMLLMSVVICSDSLGVLCPPGLVLGEVGDLHVVRGVGEGEPIDPAL